MARRYLPPRSHPAIADEFIYETATMDEKAKYWHTHETGTTLREFLGMSQDEYDAWMISGDRKSVV